ncbi:uncharacterized protein BDR25DRAFT_348257 [Lindgomyces ingoldianus]|uniref:Uncharacterized protein n=1 Tax=Lindgomyces ingoldianus TaxID=673940 RepID=A0ACB6RFR9_9PLEO|nr:uncharacterized protein BDR25DRAFT_348257 [Lindgomyces ingoldianus]KAF2477962.1 hypothetical protein BDR25DRAFT_348257 [Lindgomyces ingoldianus]
MLLQRIDVRPNCSSGAVLSTLYNAFGKLSPVHTFMNHHSWLTHHGFKVIATQCRFLSHRAVFIVCNITRTLLCLKTVGAPRHFRSRLYAQLICKAIDRGVANISSVAKPSNRIILHKRVFTPSEPKFQSVVLEIFLLIERIFLASEKKQLKQTTKPKNAMAETTIFWGRPIYKIQETLDQNMHSDILTLTQESAGSTSKGSGTISLARQLKDLSSNRRRRKFIENIKRVHPAFSNAVRLDAYEQLHQDHYVYEHRQVSVQPVNLIKVFGLGCGKDNSGKKRYERKLDAISSLIQRFPKKDQGIMFVSSEVTLSELKDVFQEQEKTTMLLQKQHGLERDEEGIYPKTAKRILSSSASHVIVVSLLLSESHCSLPPISLKEETINMVILEHQQRMRDTLCELVRAFVNSKLHESNKTELDDARKHKALCIYLDKMESFTLRDILIGFVTNSLSNLPYFTSLDLPSKKDDQGRTLNLHSASRLLRSRLVGHFFFHVSLLLVKGKLLFSSCTLPLPSADSSQQLPLTLTLPLRPSLVGMAAGFKMQYFNTTCLGERSDINSNFHPHWMTHAYSDIPSLQHPQLYPTPHNGIYPPYTHHRWRGSYWNYHPHRLCSKFNQSNQLLRPKCHAYQHPKFAELLQPQPPGQEPDARKFEWKYPNYSSSDPFGLEREISPSPRPMSPLGHIVESSGSEIMGSSMGTYEPGYACTISDLGDGDGTENRTENDGNEHGDGPLAEFANEHSTCVDAATDNAKLGSRSTDVHHENEFGQPNLRRKMQSNTAPLNPAEAQRHQDPTLTTRWKELLAREARLTAAEVAFQTTIQEERQRLDADREKLEQQRCQVQLKGLKVHQLRAHFRNEQRRLHQERLHQRRSLFHGRATWSNHEPWMGEAEDFDCDMGVSDNDLDRFGDDDFDMKDSDTDFGGAFPTLGVKRYEKGIGKSKHSYFRRIQHLLGESLKLNFNTRPLFRPSSFKPPIPLPLWQDRRPPSKSHMLPQHHMTASGYNLEENHFKFNTLVFSLWALSLPIPRVGGLRELEEAEGLFFEGGNEETNERNIAKVEDKKGRETVDSIKHHKGWRLSMLASTVGYQQTRYHSLYLVLESRSILTGCKFPSWHVRTLIDQFWSNYVRWYTMTCWMHFPNTATKFNKTSLLKD